MGPRSVLGVLGLLLAGHASEAQVPLPPCRSIDNDHKTSARQDTHTTLFARAWAICLSPHFGGKSEREIREAFEPELQNQYSDWATYDFYREVGDLLCEDMGMNGHVSPPCAMRDELEPGGCLVPVVDEVLARAVATSGGVLLFDDSTGGFGFQYQHDLVMLGDPVFLGQLERLVRQRELSKEREAGIRELAARSSACLVDAFPIRNKSDFRVLVAEALSRPSTDAALQGLRSKLRSGLREDVRGARSLTTVQEHFRLEEEVEERIDREVASTFWDELRFHHENMLADPERYRPIFRREKSCDL